MSEKSEYKYFLIYPETHKHLGLFQDLSNNTNVEMIVAQQKMPRTKLLKAIKRLHVSWTINKHIPLPFKSIWYKKITIDIPQSQKCCVIVVDGALKMLKIGYLNSLFKKKNVRGVLVLVNSMDAQSIAILETKKMIPKVNWDDVYTFDCEDSKKYNYKNLGCCYYSMHDVEKIKKSYSNIPNSDVYFTGTIKGGREQLIMSVFEKLNTANVNCNFNIMITGTRRLKQNMHSDIIRYYSGGWIPYEEVLANVINSDVILEVLQEGQSGPSLRYYEAICYNKRLLTNNPNIVNFPYYDERFMRIFNNADDVDVQWIKNKQFVDYGYKGEFSPIGLLGTVIK